MAPNFEELRPYLQTRFRDPPRFVDHVLELQRKKWNPQLHIRMPNYDMPLYQLDAMVHCADPDTRHYGWQVCGSIHRGPKQLLRILKSLFSLNCFDVSPLVAKSEPAELERSRVILLDD
jgi:hypothetical protein